MTDTIDKSNKVLLVVDVQNSAVENAYNREIVIGNINTVIAKARGKAIPILFVQHSDDDLIEGSNGWKFVNELDVRKEDQVIPKHYNSAFEETNLESYLRDQKINEIVLVGAATNWCIRATAYGALDRGYDLTLIGDGHTTESIELTKDKGLKAEDIILDLNIAMKWLRYPKRSNKVLKAKEIEF